MGHTTVDIQAAKPCISKARPQDEGKTERVVSGSNLKDFIKIIQPVVREGFAIHNPGDSTVTDPVAMKFKHIADRSALPYCHFPLRPMQRLDLHMPTWLKEKYPHQWPHDSDSSGFRLVSASNKKLDQWNTLLSGQPSSTGSLKKLATPVNKLTTESLLNSPAISMKHYSSMLHLLVLPWMSGVPAAILDNKSLVADAIYQINPDLTVSLFKGLRPFAEHLTQTTEHMPVLCLPGNISMHLVALKTKPPKTKSQRESQTSSAQSINREKLLSTLSSLRNTAPYLRTYVDTGKILPLSDGPESIARFVPAPDGLRLENCSSKQHSLHKLENYVEFLKLMMCQESDIVRPDLRRPRYIPSGSENCHLSPANTGLISPLMTRHETLTWYTKYRLLLAKLEWQGAEYIPETRELYWEVMQGFRDTDPADVIEAKFQLLRDIPWNPVTKTIERYGLEVCNWYEQLEKINVPTSDIVMSEEEIRLLCANIDGDIPRYLSLGLASMNSTKRNIGRINTALKQLEESTVPFAVCKYYKSAFMAALNDEYIFFRQMDKENDERLMDIFITSLSRSIEADSTSRLPKVPQEMLKFPNWLRAVTSRSAGTRQHYMLFETYHLIHQLLILDKEKFLEQLDTAHLEVIQMVQSMGSAPDWASEIPNWKDAVTNLYHQAHPPGILSTEDLQVFKSYTPKLKRVVLKRLFGPDYGKKLKAIFSIKAAPQTMEANCTDTSSALTPMSWGQIESISSKLVTVKTPTGLAIMRPDNEIIPVQSDILTQAAQLSEQDKVLSMGVTFSPQEYQEKLDQIFGDSRTSCDSSQAEAYFVIMDSSSDESSDDESFDDKASKHKSSGHKRSEHKKPFGKSGLPTLVEVESDSD